MASTSQKAENCGSQNLTNGVSKPKGGKCGKLGGILAENQTAANSVNTPKGGKAEKFASIFV